MILQSSEEMLVKLISDIQDIEDQDVNGLLYNTVIVETIKERIAELKKLVITSEFENTIDEIAFFKKVKPNFVSLQLYYWKIHSVEMNKPVGTNKMLKRYYGQQLDAIRRFFDYNSEIYKYYRSGSVEMDEQLFLRNKEYPKWLVKLRIDSDERFSSAADFIFARIMANERFKKYIDEKMRTINDALPNPIEIKQKLWTGDAIDLVELAYGLHYTKKINDGKIGISETVKWLEIIFNIKVGRAYRRFTEIKRRKMISKTKLFDEMKEALLKKLDEENEYKPENKKSMP